MSLFRKNALDALSTPEKLDEPTRLITPSQWLLLYSLGVFGIIILIWSIFGRIPVRLSGKGLLIIPEGVSVLESETPGRIKSLNVSQGDCISPKQPLVVIDPVTQELNTSRSRLHLAHLRRQDKEQDRVASRRLSRLKDEIKRIEVLVNSGAISLDQYTARLKEYDALETEVISSNNQREYQIAQEEASIQINNREILRSSTVYSPVTGCVVDVSTSLGKFVQPGAPLLTIQDSSKLDKLQSIAFFPTKDGKRIKAGQPVKVVPATSKQQRHGAINGTIISASDLPATRASVLNRFGLSSLLSSVSINDTQPMIEVLIKLNQDSSTYSGYDWGGAPGPNLKITQGTPTQVRVLVEQRAPISYIIPLLRDLTSIY